MKKSAATHKQADKFAAATLALLARYGWGKVPSGALAKQAGTTKHDAEEYLADPRRLCAALTAYISRRAMANYRRDTDATVRDSLFELFMLRFDVLQEYRPGILAIIMASRRAPSLHFAVAQNLAPALQEMWGAASTKPAQPLNTLGLLALYAATLRVWINDQTTDLAPTMAALDRILRRADSMQQKICSFRNCHASEYTHSA